MACFLLNSSVYALHEQLKNTLCPPLAKSSAFRFLNSTTANPMNVIPIITLTDTAC